MPATSISPLKKVPSGLFWSAPLELDSDFTAEDPLAFDYLGQQVGNWLFRGFTTRTSRPQYYSVVLYGLHLAEIAIRHYDYPADDKTRTHLFERWERFWALATLESRDGILERGDPDGMRGVRGAQRAWFGGDRPLPLDFPLLSRQLELGGLGAYLTSLRDYRLVFPGTLKVTPAAGELLETFWTKSKKRSGNQYERYALEALDLNRRKIPRKISGLTLSGIGKRSRLSSIDGRPDKQNQLWKLLFANSNDGSTLPLAEQLIRAHDDGIVRPEELLVGVSKGKWGDVDVAVLEKIRVSIAFGRLAKFLLACFDRAYEYVDSHGWVADFESVAEAAFPDTQIAEVQALCSQLHKAPGSVRFGKLKFHGPEFLSLTRKLVGANSRDSLEHLLSYHIAVQRARRGSGAWIRHEQEKLIIQVAGYNGYKTEPDFPSFKLNVVARLLSDVGWLA